MPIITLDTISTSLAKLQHPEPAVDNRSRASVAMILAERNHGLQMFFIERAANDNDPWSGNLAFPGGRVEQGEELRQTAERETFEEIGLDLSAARPVGRLLDIIGAYLPVRVSCFVYGYSGELPQFVANHEVCDSFWVDLHDLTDPKRHIMTDVRFRDSVHNEPAILLPQPDKPVLWGITYRLVMQSLEFLPEWSRTGLQFPPDEIH